MTLPSTYRHESFEAHLNEVWPLWREYIGTPLYHKMYRAFNAGFKAAKEEPLPVIKEESKKRMMRGRHWSKTLEDIVQEEETE